MLHLLKRTRKQGGFTLLELLMVVIIIAILASLALPQYIRATERSRATESLQILGALRASEHRYRAQSTKNDYTGALAELDADVPLMDSWNAPVFAVTAGGAAAKGQITTARNNGQFSAKTVGIQLGTGTICGDFPPMATAACVQD